MQAQCSEAGTRTDKGCGRQAHERDAYIENGLGSGAEPGEPGTTGLALFDEVAP
jgi:hypothetical protein